MGLVTPAAVEAFRRDGAAVLRGAFKDWVETLRAGIEKNIASPSADARIYDGAAGGRFFGDYCNWARVPEFEAFIRRSPAAEAAAELMGSKSVRLFHEYVLVKEPAADVATPWHQDQPYYCVEGEKCVSLWIPLDDVPRERTPEFVAGSHRWGRLFRPERFNRTALNEDDGLEPVPDIDANRADYDILGWALAPGDAVAFHYKSLHGAPANASPSARRRAFSLRLVGDGATFFRQEGRTTSPPMREVALKHGDPLDGPQFPVLIVG